MSSSQCVLDEPSTRKFFFELNGVFGDSKYQRCRFLIEELSVLYPQFIPKLQGTTEREYLAYTMKLQSNDVIPKDRRQWHLHQTDPFFLVNDREYLAGEDAFIAFAIQKTRMSRSEILIAAAFGASVLCKSGAQRYAAVDAEEALEAKAEQAAKDAWFRYRSVADHHYVYIVFEIDGVTLPRVEIELFHRKCPRTCANFVAFCEGRVPDIADNVRMLGYKGTLVHRIVPGGWIQAGDVDVTDPLSRDNGPLRSLYGREFPDECFTVPFDEDGVVAMANQGKPHTNGSQFFITLASLPYLQRSHVAFGRIISGLVTIQAISRLETVRERPTVPCKIVAAGRIKE